MHVVINGTKISKYIDVVRKMATWEGITFYLIVCNAALSFADLSLGWHFSIRDYDAGVDPGAGKGRGTNKVRSTPLKRDPL